MDGSAAEARVARELAGRGMTILARNWRARSGELDVVALCGDTVVFVEVRHRAVGALVGPAESVDREKRRRLLATAQAFLRSRRLEGRPARFDLACVVGDAIEILQGAIE